MVCSFDQPCERIDCYFQEPKSDQVDGRYSHDRCHYCRPSGALSYWGGTDTGGHQRRSHSRPVTVSRTVAAGFENLHTSRISLDDEFSAGIFEDQAGVETEPDCTASARRGPRLHRLCALVASTGGRLSFDGWAGPSRCAAPSRTRRVVCSEPQLRHENRSVRSCMMGSKILSGIHIGSALVRRSW